MTPSTADPSVLPDIVSGAGIALWYSLPDYTASPRTRAVVKTGIIAASAAYGAHVLRSRSVSPADGLPADGAPATGAPADGLPADEAPLPGEPATEEPAPDPLVGRPAGIELGRPAVIGLAVVLLGATAAVTVLMERFVYRFGDGLSGRGVRLAHTRIGVALAVLSTLATVAADSFRNRRTGAAAARAAR